MGLGLLHDVYILGLCCHQRTTTGLGLYSQSQLQRDAQAAIHTAVHIQAVCRARCQCSMTCFMSTTYYGSALQPTNLEQSIQRAEYEAERCLHLLQPSRHLPTATTTTLCMQQCCQLCEPPAAHSLTTLTKTTQGTSFTHVCRLCAMGCSSR